MAAAVEGPNLGAIPGIYRWSAASHPYWVWEWSRLHVHLCWSRSRRKYCDLQHDRECPTRSRESIEKFRSANRNGRRFPRPQLTRKSETRAAESPRPSPPKFETSSDRKQNSTVSSGDLRRLRHEGRRAPHIRKSP